MTSILLMGGSRFIGKHLLDKLATEAENDILVINRGSIPNEEYLPEGVDHIALDRNDKNAMKAALKNRNFDLIFDISGITAEQSQILLDCLNRPPQRHIHVSSVAVYDNYREDSPISSLPQKEDFPIGPINENEHPYMNNKRGGEKVLWNAYHEKNYPIIIVRPTYVYGPDNYIYREAYFFDRLTQDRPILLPFNGRSFIDLVHVDDLADLMIHVSKLPEQVVIGEAYNATKGDAISYNLYAKLTAKILGKSPEIYYYDPKELDKMDWPTPKFYFPYAVEAENYGSSRKIEHQLNFKNQFDYEEGFMNSYQWWKDHGERKDDYRLEDALIEYVKSKGTEGAIKTRADLVEMIDMIHKEEKAKNVS